jgi:hypothetical protein
MIFLFVLMARKVDDGRKFVFMQLTEHESGLWDTSHSDYGRRVKMVLASEEISYEMECPSHGGEEYPTYNKKKKD